MFQLQRLVSAMSRYHTDCHNVMRAADVFPIEVDLSLSTFSYDTSAQFNDDDDDDDGDGGGEGPGEGRELGAADHEAISSDLIVTE